MTGKREFGNVRKPTVVVVLRVCAIRRREAACFREKTVKAMAHTGRRRVFRYYGRVQGVGFRFTVRELARGRPVSGYVRNMPDGSVELVVEGDAEEIDRFAADIERTMGRFIRRVESVDGPAQGGFSGFEIRYR